MDAKVYKNYLTNNNETSTYGLFKNKHDCLIVKWINRQVIIKSVIDNYLKDPNQSLFWELNSFTNTDSLKEKLWLIEDRITSDS